MHARLSHLSDLAFLYSAIAETIKLHLPDLEADPLRFTEVVLGLEWIKDTPYFLTHKERPQLPDSPLRLGPHNQLPKFAQTGILSVEVIKKKIVVYSITVQHTFQLWRKFRDQGKTPSVVKLEFFRRSS